MIKPNESNKAQLPKPIEIMIADALFIRINTGKNHFQITDLNEKHTHYSLWFYGDTIDFHKTLEPHNNLPKKQMPLFNKEFDWQLLMERMAQDMWANHNHIARRTKINDSEWKDLEVKFIPIPMLTELLPSIVRGNRWNFDVDFLNKLEDSFRYAKLKELTDCPVVLGKSAEGYFVVSNGTDCVISDGDRFSKIIEKNLGLLIGSK